VPLPTWLAKVNKRVFNPLEIRRGKRPVLTHVGRSSGTTYHTPLDAHRVDGGYIFIANYGSRSDWVRNVLAAGSARLRVDGGEIDLHHPRLLAEEEARRQLPENTKPMPKYLNITEYLLMDIADHRL
jgi:deazaflavin-dependent oxidoreductase (nitroreductase family)